MREFKKQLISAGVGLLLIHGTNANGALIWHADFESYANEEAVTVNSSGSNDTFNRTLNGGLAAATTVMEFNDTSGSFVATGNFTLQQNAFAASTFTYALVLTQVSQQRLKSG